jgi:hypothetical protein
MKFALQLLKTCTDVHSVAGIAAGLSNVAYVLAVVGVHSVADVPVIAVIHMVAGANSVSEVPALDGVLLLLRCALRGVPVVGVPAFAGISNVAGITGILMSAVLMALLLFLRCVVAGVPDVADVPAIVGVCCCWRHFYCCHSFGCLR